MVTLSKVIYWLAVMVISLALLVAFVMLIESRDKSAVETGVLMLF